MKEVKITVVSKNAIIVVDDSTLTLGDSFDPMKGVRAYDGNVSLVQKAASQATDITSAVTIESNNVDTKKVGEYQVVYTVAGSNGIQVKKTRKISILAKDAVIKAENSTIKVGETFQPLKTVKAYDGDEKHTDISAKIEVKQNKVDNKKVGSYPVTYAVVGSNGKEITKQIAVTVKKIRNEIPRLAVPNQKIRKSNLIQVIQKIQKIQIR
ncbi:Bacterial Ig-like domain (group 3) [Listeria grayi]|uniref:Bacterial Ig-like domain (Group 3) n=1 Tax=Listeria grayi TaxID=1641 RepID=A0A378MJ55_LISGR|nr:immunoglobulin-like domain-containing protein [Listeria grayi]STY43775.1 Bacterial Ig-like domain (group 3) [Listeria grayi]